MIATPVLPGPRARFPGTHLLAFSRDMLGFVCRLKREYGDVIAFRLGPERMVLLSHPEHLHEVLVRQHRAFQKGRRGDVSEQWLGEGLLNRGFARDTCSWCADHEHVHGKYRVMGREEANGPGEAALASCSSP